MPIHIPSCVRLEYLTRGRWCYAATGKTRWSKQSKGRCRGSIILSSIHRLHVTVKLLATQFVYALDDPISRLSSRGTNQIARNRPSSLKRIEALMKSKSGIPRNSSSVVLKYHDWITGVGYFTSFCRNSCNYILMIIIYYHDFGSQKKVRGIFPYT